MTDKQTLAQSLRRYGSDFISHPVSRGIDDIETAGELMLEAARVLAEQPAEQPSEQPSEQEPVGIIRADVIGWFVEWRVPIVQLGVDIPLYTSPQPAEQPAEQDDNSLAALRDMLRVEVDRLIAAKSPQPAKQKSLTEEDIDLVWAAHSFSAHQPSYVSWANRLGLARAIIAAYEAKNGIGGQT